MSGRGHRARLILGRLKGHPLLRLELPTLLAPNPDLKGLIKEVHEIFGDLGYALIGLHTIAALYHHPILKDNTLTNMLPPRRS